MQSSEAQRLSIGTKDPRRRQKSPRGSKFRRKHGVTGAVLKAAPMRGDMVHGMCIVWGLVYPVPHPLIRVLISVLKTVLISVLISV